MTVKRWTFQNRNNPADQYVFPMNPQHAESPFPAKNITAETTISLTGNVLLMEGNSTPTQWSFTGLIRTQAELDTFTAWYQRSTRIYLFDDLGYRMTIFMTAFDPVREAGTNNPWRMRYTIKALVIDRLGGF